MRYDLADHEWGAIKRSCRTSRGAFRVLMTGAYSTASFGSCVPRHHGAITHLVREQNKKFLVYAFTQSNTPTPCNCKKRQSAAELLVI